MARKITVERLEEIENGISTNDFATLEKYTGIKTKPYTGYSYYDEVGNYLGDAEDVE